MIVKSGKCRLCESGINTKHKTKRGEELHTGDIVMLWHGSYIGTELEEWVPDSGLTCIVADQFTSFSDGSVVEKKGELVFFAMGIKDCGFDSDHWDIRIVKKYSDVVVGEHWPDYGFSYEDIPGLEKRDERSGIKT